MENRGKKENGRLQGKTGSQTDVVFIPLPPAPQTRPAPSTATIKGTDLPFLNKICIRIYDAPPADKVERETLGDFVDELLVADANLGKMNQFLTCNPYIPCYALIIKHVFGGKMRLIDDKLIKSVRGAFHIFENPEPVITPSLQESIVESYRRPHGSPYYEAEEDEVAEFLERHRGRSAYYFIRTGYSYMSFDDKEGSDKLLDLIKKRAEAEEQEKSDTRKTRGS